MLGQGSVTEALAGQFAFKSAPLVVANILAPLLIRLFDAGLADLIEPNGEIILSGILDQQKESVIDAGQAKGLKRGAVRQIKDWVAISMKK
jgi:ribosomal protein L11 methyltransferase